MLRPDELRWLPWAPLLLAEGLYARLATSRLPPAADARGKTGQGRRVLRLAGIGDSIIAGIGVSSQREGLVGQVARACAERAAARIEWLAVGESGATSRQVLEQLLPVATAQAPQLVVLSIGVNDAVAGVPPGVFKHNLKAIVDALGSGRSRPAVVFGGIPPLESFPALPWPLSRLLGARARALQHAAIELTGYRGLRVVVFPQRLERDAFSRDGFHPGPDGCAAWASWVTDGFSQAIEEGSGPPG